ncbi:hypothetical protein [Ralstonia pseudosolanacearum]
MSNTETQQAQVQPGQANPVDEEEDFLSGIQPQADACPIDGSCESCQ